LIWLSVSLVRRSSISNMAFSPGAHVRFSGAGVAPTHRRYEKCYAFDAANGRAPD
jgi:hypothetical protein